jgi:Cu(I)/Ag(I) efflux system membrane fusion protein
VSQLFNKKVTTVKREQKQTQKVLYGNTRVNESRVFDVSLKFDGFIQTLYVDKPFLKVKQGDPLFSIYSTTLSNIKEELVLAQRASQTNLVALLHKKLSLLDVTAPISDAYTVEMRSPFSGYVIEKHIYQGSFVKRGQALYRIADYSTLWVIAKAYQKDIAHLKQGMEVSISIEGVGKYKSTIDAIYPFMNSETKTYDVRMVLENKEEKLFPNLFAKVRVEQKRDSILTLPKSAVLTKGEKHYVFKPMNEETFEPVKIEAKRIDAQTFEVLGGLKEGEKVIDNALFLLDSEAVTNALYESDDEEW